MPLSLRRLISRQVGRFITCFLFSLLAKPAAQAGTIRHDVDPAAYTVLGADLAYQSVGRLEIDEIVSTDGATSIGVATGTGTLIAPGWVMTAAHVVEGSLSMRFVVAGQTYTASRWVSHPKYDGELFRGYDLALVQLTAAVPGITPAQLYRAKREYGQVGTFVGVGRTGTGLTGDTTEDQIVRAGTNVIDGKMKRLRDGRVALFNKKLGDSLTFAADFDQPGNPAVNHFGSPEPTALEFLISRGDSGGPVFIDDPKDKAGLVVAGIHSSGQYLDELDDSSYGDVTGHTRVSKFAKWIDKAMFNEKYQQKLDFVTPTPLEEQTGAAIPTDPAARLLPATIGVPEPTVLSVLTLSAFFLLSNRRRAGTSPSQRRDVQSDRCKPV